MTRPAPCSEQEIAAWLGAHPAWRVEERTLVRDAKFAGYPATIGFVVAIGLEAEKRDHHPDLFVGWGKVQVRWTTHDAGGITALDLALADATDALAR